MPVSIYSESTRSSWRTSLCDDEWELPKQVPVLEAWLKKNKKKLPPGRYVADIGFMVRKDAAGGGAALPSAMLGAMAELKMSLFLSEYRR
jgi:hypothetical protein